MGAALTTPSYPLAWFRAILSRCRKHFKTLIRLFYIGLDVHKKADPAGSISSGRQSHAFFYKGRTERKVVPRYCLFTLLILREEVPSMRPLPNIGEVFPRNVSTFPVRPPTSSHQYSRTELLGGPY